MSEQTAVVNEQLPVAQTFEVTHSEGIGKLAGALALAQVEFLPVLKQNENQAFMRGNVASKYADLATVIDATQKALAKQGLVVLQWPDVSVLDQSTRLTSMLVHSSGEWLKGTLTLPATNRSGFTAQSCGSSITYARRYSYSAIIGVAPEEDDDGNRASGLNSKEAAQAVAKRKIEESAQKTASVAPTASGKPPAPALEGIPASEVPPAGEGKLTAFKEIKNGMAVLSIAGEDVYTYGNHDVPTPTGNVKLFEMLELAASAAQMVTAEIGRKRLADGTLVYTKTGHKPVWEAKRFLQIGAFEWLEDGTPVIRREQEPTGETQDLWPKK